MSLQLAHTAVSNPRLPGRSPPLLVLHGLFGMARNWRSVAKSLARWHSPVVCADLRNHGDSPHHADMSMPAMVGDVRLLIEDQLACGPVHLMGHSLGGKVAMMTALQHPQLVKSLIVVDASPQPSGSKPGWFRRIMELLLSLDVAKPPAPSLVAARKAYSEFLTAEVPEKSIREFLLTNLMEDPASPGSLKWRINLPALLAHIEEMVNCELHSCDLAYRGPAVFIGGSKSPYIDPQDASIPRLFPQSRIVFVPGAGHWVHADRPAEFCTQVADFLASISPSLNNRG